MLHAVAEEQSLNGVVYLRKHLQAAALNNIMGTVFGKRYDTGAFSEEVKELHEIVREGFEILGAFNWSDYLPWLKYFYDPYRINKRCSVLVPRIRKLVKQIIKEHELRDQRNLLDNSDFVDVLLSMDEDEKLDEEDMIAVLWVRILVFLKTMIMIFNNICLISPKCIFKTFIEFCFKILFKFYVA